MVGRPAAAAAAPVLTSRPPTASSSCTAPPAAAAPATAARRRLRSGLLWDEAAVEISRRDGGGLGLWQAMRDKAANRGPTEGARWLRAAPKESSEIVEGLFDDLRALLGTRPAPAVRELGTVERLFQAASHTMINREGGRELLLPLLRVAAAYAGLPEDQTRRLVVEYAFATIGNVRQHPDSPSASSPQSPDEATRSVRGGVAAATVAEPPSGPSPDPSRRPYRRSTRWEAALGLSRGGSHSHEDGSPKMDTPHAERPGAERDEGEGSAGMAGEGPAGMAGEGPAGTMGTSPLSAAAATPFAPRSVRWPVAPPSQPPSSGPRSRPSSAASGAMPRSFTSPALVVAARRGEESFFQASKPESKPQTPGAKTPSTGSHGPETRLRSRVPTTPGCSQPSDDSPLPPFSLST